MNTQTHAGVGHIIGGALGGGLALALFGLTGQPLLVALAPLGTGLGIAAAERLSQSLARRLTRYA
jgi:hypothetical protein